MLITRQPYKPCPGCEQPIREGESVTFVARDGVGWAVHIGCATLLPPDYDRAPGIMKLAKSYYPPNDSQ